MEEMLPGLSNPYILALIVLLTIVSTIYCWIGWREKNWGKFIIGTGIGIPTMDMTDWRYWLFAIAVCGVGFWFTAKSDSI